jgi:hypothetical protein
MSQRLNSGFNWPGFSVAAGEPDAPVPEPTAHRISESILFPLTCSARQIASVVIGVGQGESCCACTCPFTGIFQVPSDRGLESPTFGVGQPASRAATDSGNPSARVPDSTSFLDFASCSSGVLPVL